MPIVNLTGHPGAVTTYERADNGDHLFAPGSSCVTGYTARTKGANTIQLTPTELARVPDIKALVEAVDEYLRVEGYSSDGCDCVECLARDKLIAVRAKFPDLRTGAGQEDECSTIDATTTEPQP